MNIHPKAIVDEGARIGAGVVIGPGAVIERDVELGEGCHVGPNAVIHRYTRLGAQCRVHAGAVIGDTPQDLAFHEVASFTIIGARCVLREGVTIHRGTKEGTETVVGDDCYLMANSHLAHNVRLGNRVIMANGSLLGGYVEVEEGAFISGNAVVHQFCRIGRLAMIGGLSGIGKDVPPFCMTKSGLVNLVVGLNVVGLRRNGFSPESRRDVKQAFEILYRRGLNVSQAIQKIKNEFPAGPARALADFVENSKRGICAWSGGDEATGA